MHGAAAVYSLADEQRARTEDCAWTQFTAAQDGAEFHTAWLALLAGRIGRARAALLLTESGGPGHYGVAAVWPDPQRDLQYLGPVAQQALEQREGLVVAPDGVSAPQVDGPAYVAYPLDVGGVLFGAVVFDLAGGPSADLQAALRQIHWSSAWLVDRARQQQLAQRSAELARVSLLNELMATALQHARMMPSAHALANEMAQRMQCDRVSVGIEEHGQVRPKVLSHTSNFDAASDLVRWLAEAMDEALDLGGTIVHPSTDEDVGAITHAESARLLGVAHMLSVPLRHQGGTVGILTLERNRGPAFSADERALAEAVGVMLGEIWALKRRNERGLLPRARDSWREASAEMFGPRHPGIKAAGAVLASALLVTLFWQTEHRVTGRTLVEGSTQIAAVVPFDGFIEVGHVRAGDTVRKGQPLARLDDRDLKLERSRWVAEREQLSRRYQVAQSQADRAAMGVLAAQVHQAEAQLALVEERLARATLIAPYDGVVVSGDLSQRLGSPVQTGQQLFEVAPLEAFRVTIEVDDRDINWVALGQPGELVLSGMPGQAWPLTVQRLRSIATQREGRNLFAVEARLEGAAPPGLRPGMEGVGKVVVGERSLLWVWTHGLVDWLRLALWTWMP